MKTLKKLICLLAVLALTVSLMACGSKKTETSDTEPAAPENPATAEKTAEPAEEPSVELTDVTVPMANPDDIVETEDVPGTDAPDAPEMGEFIQVTDGAVTKFASYAVDPVEGGDPRMANVVVKCGDRTLTNAGLQVFYRMQYFDFMNQYGSYAYYFGLDTTKPLNEQQSMAGDMTWEQYFLYSAIEQFHKCSVIAAEGEKAGFQLPADVQNYLDNVAGDLDAQAIEGGYDSGEAYMQQSFGSGVSMKDFVDYMNLYYFSGYYGNELADSVDVSESDILAYYAENEETIASYGYEKTDKFDINVRHILLKPGTDENGASSDEDWAAAEAKANEVYELYLADPTEDNFAALALEYTGDSNGEQGGIYENVYYGQMVPEFQDWCFDPSRQVGDTGIVKTDFGYHIMYFCGTCDTMGWYEYTKSQCTSGKVTELIEGLADAMPAYAAYADIVIETMPLDDAG